VYAPLVEKGWSLSELAHKPFNELKGMVRLMNRLEKFRSASSVVKRCENGSIKTSEISNEEATLLAHYTDEMDRIERSGIGY